MFKSKGFTVAFVILSVMILGLSGIFIYLLTSPEAATTFEMKFIAGTSTAELTDTAAYETTTEKDEETTEAPTTEAPTTTREPDTELRGLAEYDTHILPVLDEDIPLTGTLKIIRSGQSGEGLAFSRYPRFASVGDSGTQTIYSGEFNIIAKLYTLENGRPAVLYKTEDDYYVTGSSTYVEFTPGQEPTVAKDSSKVTSYGYDENSGAVVVVYNEDGDHLTFSVFNYVSGNTEEVLVNLIAEYDSEGVGHFEYQNTDGRTYEGTISFENVNDAYVSKRVILWFEDAISMLAGDVTDIVLHN